MMLVVSVALAWTPTCVSEPLDTGVPLFELAAGETHVVAGSGFGAVWIMPDPGAGCSASLFTVPNPGRVAEGGRVTAGRSGGPLSVFRWDGTGLVEEAEFRESAHPAWDRPLDAVQVIGPWAAVLEQDRPSEILEVSQLMLGPAGPSHVATWTEWPIWVARNADPTRSLVLAIDGIQTRNMVMRFIGPTGPVTLPVPELPQPIVPIAFDGRTALLSIPPSTPDTVLELQLWRFDGIAWHAVETFTPVSSPDRVAVQVFAADLRDNVLVVSVEEQRAADDPEQAVILLQRSPSGWEHVDNWRGSTVTSLTLLRDVAVAAAWGPGEGGADTGGRDPEVSRLHVLPIVPRDHDGDGLDHRTDCDDGDPAMQVASIDEICGDNFDNDCDGSVDEGCPVDTDTPDTDLPDSDPPVVGTDDEDTRGTGDGKDETSRCGGCATATRAWAWWLPLAILRIGRTRLPSASRRPRRNTNPWSPSLTQAPSGIRMWKWRLWRSAVPRPPGTPGHRFRLTVERITP
jgi:hypothetical protein